MKLYHYTTFANFCSIWIQQKLKFSTWTNCNDIYEREKIYHYSQQSKEYNGKKYPLGVLKKFSQEVFKEIEQYRQISFSLGTKRCEGFASPMLWGQYARDHQRSGVCIEIDSSKIKFPKGYKVFRKKVSYRTNILPTHVYGVNAELENAANLFVVENRNNLFFTKHWHWKYENEYRLISKECQELDISDAITCVYVLGEDIITLQSIKNIIQDVEKISFLNIGGLSLKLQKTKLKDYEELQELIKNYKWG